MTDEDESNKEQAIQSTQEEIGLSCTICMEDWTIGGDHRICCLKCGHLFGRSCIERWIKEKGSQSKCPTCNKTAKKPDIRDLWCKSVKATDNSELIQLQQMLDNERKLRKSDSAIIFQQNLRIEVLLTDLDKLKRLCTERETKIIKLERIIDRYSKLRAASSAAAGAANTTANGDEISNMEPDLECQEVNIDVEIVPTELKGMFHFAEKIDSCQQGSCKAFAICPTAQILMIAQNAPREHQQNIFAPFGLRRYSTIDTNIKGFIPLHTKAITSIQLKPFGDLILTAGLDKRVRLTSIVNNTCIQSYNCDNEPTCVAWSAHRDQQFYVASGNCYVTLYDIRNTSEYIYQTAQKVAKTRLLSIASTSSQDLDGLLVNDLKGSQYLDVSQESSYELESIDRSLEHLRSHNLPFEGLMGSVDFDKAHNLALISTRKTPVNPNCTHHLIRLNKGQTEEGTMSVSTNSVKTFTGGSTGEQPLLSHSRILKHPTLNDHVLVGASDQASRGVKLWDSSDSSVYQTIRTDKYIRDMAMFSPENSNQHVLYLLSESGFNVYRWDYA